MPLPYASYFNVVPVDLIATAFTQADGALTTLPQIVIAPVTSGSPTVVSNQANLPVGAKYGFTHSKSDVQIKAKLVSNAGEAIYFRGDGTGYFYVANNAGNTILNYFLIAGSVVTTLGSFLGAAANDIVEVVAQGSFITVVRNNRVVIEASSQLNLTSKEHGIRNPLGAGAVLVDDFLLVPAM